MEGMDELMDREYTKEQQEQDRQTREDLLLPAGQYRTKPALTFEARVGDRDFNRGRLQYRFFAQVENKADGTRGGIGFTISPDKGLTKAGRPDGASVLWTQAVKAFVFANGREPHRTLEVAEYIRDYAVDLRVTKMPETDEYDASNQVRSISPVRD